MFILWLTGQSQKESISRTVLSATRAYEMIVLPSICYRTAVSYDLPIETTYPNTWNFDFKDFFSEGKYA